MRRILLIAWKGRVQGAGGGKKRGDKTKAEMMITKARF